ncbi:MAG: AAA family ATPase [Candidatus Kapabacteria bacterium]|jgi:predicted ATP-binding protein involved in virulence|nr:AAA family ATPase [Candidatus Kapabacteria bacterium]
MTQEQNTIAQNDDVFITKLTIDNVRHLKNVEILLSETERKHLILTGRNGSGKTSVLRTLKSDLHSYSIEAKYDKLLFERQEVENDASLRAIDRLQQVDQKIQMVRGESQGLVNSVKIANLYEATVSFQLHDADNEHLKKLLVDKKYFVCYFEAIRQASFQVNTNNIRRTDAFNEDLPNLDQKIGSLLTEYMNSLDHERLRKKEKNDAEAVQEINSWFREFEKNLQDVFADKHCRLEYDDEIRGFKIHLTNRAPIGFHELSDGYSALLSIVGELMMRMENQAGRYNAQGIVLIDEIEAHLHIELQKIVLPFLMRLFPRIQFIVTTHSPFVLNSIENAVVFDLENHERVEDLSAYSVNAIIKAYFGQDEYSAELKQYLVEFEELVKREKSLTGQELQRLEELETYFEGAPKLYSSELALKLNQIALSRSLAA